NTARKMGKSPREKTCKSVPLRTRARKSAPEGALWSMRGSMRFEQHRLDLPRTEDQCAEVDFVLCVFQHVAAVCDALERCLDARRDVFALVLEQAQDDAAAVLGGLDRLHDDAVADYFDRAVHVAAALL